MKIRLIAVVLAAVLATAGVMAFSNQSPSSTNEAATVSVAAAGKSKPEANTGVYLDDFKAGYADGFGSGVGNFTYPDQSSMASNTRGYLEGFGQGYEDGQGQQASLRSELCSNPRVSGVTGAFPEYGAPRYSSSRLASPSTGQRSLSTSTVDRSFSSRPVERPIDRGIGTTARRAMLIGGGAAAGAGIGGAVGGKKGALIGALVGGGTGTVLAVKKTPSRAFDRRVSKKTVLLNTLLGAGAGAGIGALAGGKRGALAGAGIGGGGGALYSLMTGKRTRR